MIKHIVVMYKLISGLLVAFCCFPVNTYAASLRFIDAYVIPTGTQFEGVEFGGISGLEKTQDGDYLAISDERGNEHGGPRFYHLSLDYDAKAFKKVTINSQHYFKQPNGKPFSDTQATVDPESIRVAPNGHYYWVSEGNFSTEPALRTQPHLHEVSPDGTFVKAFKIPPVYYYADGKTTGGRDNKLFESLTVDDSGTVYIVNEDALVQDGNVATPRRPAWTRITAFDPKSGRSTAQYAYSLSYTPMNGNGVKKYTPPLNGVTEMLALGNKSFLVIERAYAANTGHIIKLIKATITDKTTDISNLKSLKDQTVIPMKKSQVLFIPPRYHGLVTDNIEGITWGKTLANGNRTLILVSDNNFAKHEETQFLAFEVIGDF